MTKAATDFLYRLRHETGPFHRSIEQLPLSSLLLSKEVTLQNYRDYLIVLYGFLKTFENVVYPQVRHLVSDLEDRRKTGLLLGDLQSLGIQTGNIESFDDGFFRRKQTVAAALGAMYVLEGSTLGGQLISRHLEEVLGDSVRGSLKYLKAYSTRTGSMWKGFLNVFCEFIVQTGSQDEAINSSIDTFRRLEAWLANPDRLWSEG